MDAMQAFEKQKKEIGEQLRRAQNPQQAMTTATMALERIASELAQEETDERARQRQQAVLAQTKRSVMFMRAVKAEGQLVMQPAKEEPVVHKRLRMGARMAGAALLAILAAGQWIGGSATLCCLQLLGALLLLLGTDAQKTQGSVPAAQGILQVDDRELLRAIGECCQAVDVCVSDLALLEQDAGATRVSGTADDAMLDLLISLMEAKATGREDAAVRSLDQAESYLRMLGVTPVYFTPENAALFDVLPTISEERTIRPALMKDGGLLRRGVAACRMERGMGA